MYTFAGYQIPTCVQVIEIVTRKARTCPPRPSQTPRTTVPDENCDVGACLHPPAATRGVSPGPSPPERYGRRKHPLCSPRMKCEHGADARVRPAASSAHLSPSASCNCARCQHGSSFSRGRNASSAHRAGALCYAPRTREIHAKGVRAYAERAEERYQVFWEVGGGEKGRGRRKEGSEGRQGREFHRALCAGCIAWREGSVGGFRKVQHVDDTKRLTILSIAACTMKG